VKAHSSGRGNEIAAARAAADLRSETPRAYAQRRANETGRAYIVSCMGHAVLDCAENRLGMAECGGIEARFTARRDRAAGGVTE
jgi:hypothetical protein